MNTLIGNAQKEIDRLRREADLIEEAMGSRRVISEAELITTELMRRFPSWKGVDKDPNWSAYLGNDRVTMKLGGYAQKVEYDEMLSVVGARPSYNGKELIFEFEETVLFTNVRITAEFRCDIPDGDVAFLKEMNKIVESVETSTHSVC